MPKWLELGGVCACVTLGASCTSSTGNVLSLGEAASAGAGGSTAAAPGGSGGIDPMAGAGASGTAQVASAAGAGGAGSAPDVCEGAIYCEDFEGGLSLVGLNGAGSVELSPLSHAGAQALRASTNSVGDWARIEVPLLGRQSVFVRAWLRVEGSPMEPADRQVLLVLHPPEPGSRGGQDKLSLDWIGLQDFDLSNTRDVPMTRLGAGIVRDGLWSCVQIEVSGELGQARAYFRVDGELVAESGPGIVPTGGFDWLMFGVEYALAPAPITVFVDDIVASIEERACE